MMAIATVINTNINESMRLKVARHNGWVLSNKGCHYLRLRLPCQGTIPFAHFAIKAMKVLSFMASEDGNVKWFGYARDNVLFEEDKVDDLLEFLQSLSDQKIVAVVSGNPVATASVNLSSLNAKLDDLCKHCRIWNRFGIKFWTDGALMLVRREYFENYLPLWEWCIEKLRGYSYDPLTDAFIVSVHHYFFFRDKRIDGAQVATLPEGLLTSDLTRDLFADVAKRVASEPKEVTKSEV